MSGGMSFIAEDELGPVLSYLGVHPEIRELLVSGGDPLTAPDEELESLFAQVRRHNRALALRVCTRVPVTDPRRLDAGLIELCRRYRPLRFSVHINHPRELSPPTRLALEALAGAGIPVLVQTVLLKGVNDSAATLSSLFRECRGLGLLPYYLFQLDLAPGAAHFRVALRRGLALYRELQKAPAGAEPPVYAVDLPGGGGKIPLSEEKIAGERGDALLLKAPDGSLWAYPAG
jgi:lysine 2,3-aminomutase